MAFKLPTHKQMPFHTGNLSKSFIKVCMHVDVDVSHIYEFWSVPHILYICALQSFAIPNLSELSKNLTHD